MARTTASRFAALLLAALAIGMAWSPIASGQSGNGLYEPFPEAAVKKRAQRYVERLGERLPDDGRRYTDAELAGGVFVRPDASVPPLRLGGGAASTRAGSAGSADMALLLQALALAAVLAAPAAALLIRERARAA